MINKKDKLMVQDIGIHLGQQLVRAIAREEARDFDDEYWLMLIHEGSNKNENRVLRGQPWISLLFTSYSGTLRWYPDKSRIDEVHAYSLQLKGAHLPQRDFVKFSTHFRVKILDEYGIEVANQSIANPEYTTFVVKSREEERFANEIHDHRQELRSSNGLLETNQEGMKKDV